jgi:uncharacterized membrane protein YfcA
MPDDAILYLSAAIFIIAFLYSSVGHAGSSGYIACMAILGLSPHIIKPIALVLNILVATITTFQFYRAGHFSWRMFWPFSLLSIPCAFLGGYLNLPTTLFKILVGIVLWLSALKFLYDPKESGLSKPPSKPVAIGVGGGLGLLAGITGTGGGIFLTPLAIIMHWAPTKTASAVSALFILVNSCAGLLGNISSTKSLPAIVIPLIIAALVGGTMGSYLGSSKFSVLLVKRLLAMVLMIAGYKLIFF